MQNRGKRKKQDAEFWSLARQLEHNDKVEVRANMLWRLYRRAWRFVEPLVFGGKEDKRKRE